MAVLLGWLLPGFSAGVWSPTPKDVVETMIRLANPKPGERLVDLGYGDGRFLLTAARRAHLHAIGYDLNPFWRAWVSLRARLLGVSDRVELRQTDLFKADLEEADIVVAFLSPEAHRKLAEIFKAQLRPGARVVAYQRTLPDWDPERALEVRPGKFVYLYRR